jgi:hypothetical protein
MRLICPNKFWTTQPPAQTDGFQVKSLTLTTQIASDSES